MICKDCIHCEICPNKRKHHIVKNGFLFYFQCGDIEKICSLFIHKSIMPPCKVGDVVYRPAVDHIRKETVTQIIQYFFKDKMLLTIKTDYSTYDLSDIGIYIFFSKSDAEKYKRCKNENNTLHL